jgi:hypothetical protein
MPQDACADPPVFLTFGAFIGILLAIRGAELAISDGPVAFTVEYKFSKSRRILTRENWSQQVSAKP